MGIDILVYSNVLLTQDEKTTTCVWHKDMS